MPNLCAATAVDTVKRRCPAARRSQLVYYANLLRLTKCICNLVEASKCLDNLIKITLKAGVRVCATYTQTHVHTYIYIDCGRLVRQTRRAFSHSRKLPNKRRDNLHECSYVCVSVCACMCASIRAHMYVPDKCPPLTFKVYLWFLVQI